MFYVCPVKSLKNVFKLSLFPSLACSCSRGLTVFLLLNRRHGGGYLLINLKKMKATEQQRFDEVLKNSSAQEEWKKDLFKATIEFALEVFHESGEEKFVERYMKEPKETQAVMKLVQYIAT